MTEVGGGYSMPCQSSSKKPTSPELKEWARGAVRKILVILGDLSRYRTEFEPKINLNSHGQGVCAIDSHSKELSTNLGAAQLSILLKILVVKFCKQTQSDF